jgi:hypothetical protein
MLIRPTTTSNKQQATSNKQQATSNKQQATSNKQQATSNKQQASPLVPYQHLLTHRTRVQHTAEDQGAGSRRDGPDTGRARAVSQRGAAAETRFLARRALAQTAIESTATAALQFSRMREWTL